MKQKRPSSLRRRPFSCCSLLISAAVIHIVPAAVVCFIPAAILRLVLPGIPAAVLAILFGVLIDLLQKKVTPRGLWKEAGR